MRHAALVIITLTSLAVAPAASASTAGPFAEDLALSVYAVGNEGGYAALGVGSRARWEIDPGTFGLETYLDHLFVDAPGNFRHDHPVGFNAYFPMALHHIVRLKPLLGACAVFSFIEPEDPHAPRSDDIQFGLRAGLGVEVALAQEVSLFADAQGIVYFGHHRFSSGWTAAIDDELSATGLIQANLGLQFHFTL